MKETVFYIHGVTPRQEPIPHHDLYGQLQDGIRAHNPKWPAVFGGAEWGWNPGTDLSHDQELLSQAQLQLGNRILPEISDAKDFSLNPARIALNQLREINFYGFSDMFYYTSFTGKEAVRGAICRQLISFLRARQLEKEDISITVIGHSAGAVIAFDLLFHLFHPAEPPYDSHCFVDHEAKAESLQLRSWASEGRLKLRRLITLGNPLAAMAFRHSRVVEVFAAGERLNPAHYGLVPDDRCPGARWLNLWDLDDPLGWPVLPLMEPDSGMVEDVYVNVSDWITKAHNAYWTSKAVHKALAERW